MDGIRYEGDVTGDVELYEFKARSHRRGSQRLRRSNSLFLVGISPSSENRCADVDPVDTSLAREQDAAFWALELMARNGVGEAFKRSGDSGSFRGRVR
jgi:hypothetical protein